MRKPTIHLNGTSRNALADQLRDAAYALADAIGALAKAAPHGRDYYVQGAEAINEAIDEHNARLEKLRSVYAELVEIWGSI